MNKRAYVISIILNRIGFVFEKDIDFVLLLNDVYFYIGPIVVFALIFIIKELHQSQFIYLIESILIYLNRSK